jgi:hypothetical protein
MTLRAPGTKMDQKAGEVMKRSRSISHAPHCRIREDSDPEPTPWTAWTLCRKFESFPVRDDVMLQSWTELGRVRPDDYLVNLELDLCVQAGEVAELAAIFRKARTRLLRNACRAIACAALLLAWFSPLGAVVLVSVIAAAAVGSRKAGRPQTYSLSSWDRSRHERRSTDCTLALARTA